MPAFERGELVRLKSGGPSMTVDVCPGDESGYTRLTLGGLKRVAWQTYRCVWFDGNELKSDSFSEHLLVAADARTGEQ